MDWLVMNTSDGNDTFTVAASDLKAAAIAALEALGWRVCMPKAEPVEDRQCRICGDLVHLPDFREHLAAHNPHAWEFTWDDVLAEFADREHPEKERVLVCVRGGVAEVVRCPPNVQVAIRDFDNDRR